jgi:hypothetical protein
MATLVAEKIVMPDRDLSQTTVCLKVHFGALGTTRKISSAQFEVDADKQLIRVSKKLLDATELREIQRFDSELRHYLYEICLPYDIGIHLVPYEAVEMVEERLTSSLEDRRALVESFLRVYPELCRQISRRLRTLYNPADYPPLDYVQSKFTFGWKYLGFGAPEQLQEVSPRIFAIEREKAAQRMAEVTSEIQQVLRTTLAQMVERLRDRLTDDGDGKQKQLRESAVQKLKEFLSTFDIRNVTDDRELAAQVNKARELLDGVNADVIRNTDSLRDRIRTGMGEISARLDTMVVDRPTRKFRLPLE